MDSPAATILVVEDHGPTRTFLADNLAADGYDVIEAEGVSEARHLLERAFPDLAIVDLGLPDGDGLELLTAVRSADRTAGRLDLDPLSRQVWVQGHPVALSKKEFALLRALAAEPTRVFTRDELLRGVWNFRAMGHTRTLDSHAFRLRQKLNRAEERFVINVWG